MQVSFKIHNQLAIKPEIFTQGIAKLGEDDLFLGTMFRSYVSNIIIINHYDNLVVYYHKSLESLKHSWCLTTVHKSSLHQDNVFFDSSDYFSTCL